MKKTIIATIVFFLIFSAFSLVFADNIANQEASNNVLEETGVSQILEIKEKSKGKIDEYTEKYGSESYGLTAYILNVVRIYSIPCCFVLIAWGAICQYAIGTRRLDMKQKGFAIILSAVTILVICQVLPLVYTLIVIGWRG